MDVLRLGFGCGSYVFGVGDSWPARLAGSAGCCVGIAALLQQRADTGRVACVMVFTEEAIYTVRRIEDVRAAHGVGVAWIKSMFDLADEVKRLRAELHFYRNR